MTVASTPLAGHYVADPIHSSFNFAVQYQGVSIFRGSFGEAQAELADGRLTGSAKVESISITTPEQFRAHVLSAEFFDVENHPEVSFASDSLQLSDDGRAVLDGELTIKGITKPVHAEGAWRAPAADAFGNTRAHIQLEAVVNRLDYEMHWNVDLPSGGKALGDDVTLTVELSLVEQKG